VYYLRSSSSSIPSPTNIIPGAVCLLGECKRLSDRISLTVEWPKCLSHSVTYELLDKDHEEDIYMCQTVPTPGKYISAETNDELQLNFVLNDVESYNVFGKGHTKEFGPVEISGLFEYRGKLTINMIPNNKITLPVPAPSSPTHHPTKRRIADTGWQIDSIEPTDYSYLSGSSSNSPPTFDVLAAPEEVPMSNETAPIDDTNQSLYTSIDSHEVEIANTLLLQHNLTIVAEPKDGACLFHSCARQLSPMIRRDISAQEIRTLVCDHLERNDARFKQLLTFDSERQTAEERFVEHLKEMTKPQTYAGDIEIQAIMEIFNISIAVYSVADHELRESVNLFDEDYPSHILRLFHDPNIGSDTECHYDSVLPVNDVPPPLSTPPPIQISESSANGDEILLFGNIQEEESLLYVGEWSMSNDSKQRYPFSYTSIETGVYVGGFALANDEEITDEFRIEFQLNSHGTYNVHGSGKNQFGSFIISGLCEGNEMTLGRTYIEEDAVAAVEAPSPSIRRTTKRQRITVGYTESGDLVDDEEDEVDEDVLVEYEYESDLESSSAPGTAKNALTDIYCADRRLPPFEARDDDEETSEDKWLLSNDEARELRMKREMEILFSASESFVNMKSKCSNSDCNHNHVSPSESSEGVVDDEVGTYICR
jgi:hypothetical protein